MRLIFYAPLIREETDSSIKQGNRGFSHYFANLHLKNQDNFSNLSFWWDIFFQLYTEQLTFSCAHKFQFIYYFITSQDVFDTQTFFNFQMSTDYATVCVSAFTPNTDSKLTDTWVLGAAFLGQYYSIYNVENRTIGLVRTPN